MKTWQRIKRDPLLWNTYFVRERIIQAIRMFFHNKKFHEIETPILIGYPPAESYLDVFQTTLLDRRHKKTSAYLSTSPELALKKLLVAGIGNCYSITKSFRNGETDSKTHTPEFTILEWYRVNKTYVDLMDDCEQLIRFIAASLKKGSTLTYQGTSFDLSAPWIRISVIEAFSTYAQVDLNTFFDMDTARKIATKKGYTVTASNTWEELYNQIFLNEVEPHLGVTKPTIMYDFPSAMGALCRKKISDPRLVERFEFYIGGLEVGDCYGELTDWKEQKARFDQELVEIQRIGKTLYEYDHDFIEALKEGMPEASGIAVGLDRLIMLFTNTKTIQETQLFPYEDLFDK